MIIFTSGPSLLGGVDSLKVLEELKQSPITNVNELVQQSDALYNLIAKESKQDHKWFNKIFTSAKSLNDSLNHPLYWSQYVLLYRAEQYQKALHFADQYLTYKEEHSLPINGDFYVEAGLLYSDQSNDIKGIEYFEKAEYWYRQDSSENLTYALSAMGSLYEDVGYYEKAMEYQKESLTLALQMKNDYIKFYNTANKYKNIANLYRKLVSSEKEVTKYFDLAVNDALKQHSGDLILAIYADFIDYLLSIDKLEEAKGLIFEGNNQKFKHQLRLKSEHSKFYDLVVSKYGVAIKDPTLMTHPDTLLSATLTHEKIKQVLEYASTYFVLRDDYQNVAKYNQRKIEFLEQENINLRQSAVNLMTEREEIPTLKSNNQALERKVYSGRNILYSLLGILLFLALIQVFLVRDNKRVRELNNQIKSKNQKISNHYDDLERLAYVMTHDLKEPANTIYSFSNLIEERVGSNLPKSTEPLFEIIKKTSKGMLKSIGVLHSYLVVGQVATIEIADLDQLFNKAITNLAGAITESKAIITSDKLPKMMCYPQEIVSLFQSLLSNALKYSKRTVQPTIKLSMLEDGDNLLLSLKDNGIGIAQSSQDQIFDRLKECILMTRLREVV